MIYGILYVLGGIVVVLGTVIVMVYKSNRLCGEDYVLISVSALVAGVAWPLSIIMLLVYLVVLGVNKYKTSSENKKRLKKEAKEAQELELERTQYLSQFRDKMNILMFDRKMCEAEGWNKENYEEFCRKVDNLARLMYRNAAYDLDLSMREVESYTDVLKPVLY